MREIFNFEQGKKKSIEIIGNISERPILVGIYGLPCSGKSRLINDIGDYFDARGFKVSRHAGSSREFYFEELKDKYYILESLQLFHSAWQRFCTPDGEDILLKDDPKYLAKKVLDRELDLSIGIYNANLYRLIEGNYDLVISNFDAVWRPGLKK